MMDDPWVQTPHHELEIEVFHALAWRDARVTRGDPS